MNDQQSYIPAFVAYRKPPSSSQEHQPRHDNSIPCQAVWWIDRDTEQPQEKETSQNESRGFKCLGESFSNRVNLRSPIQTRRKRQPQHLENELSSKTNLNESTEVTNACLKLSNQVIKDGTLKEVRVTYLKHLILAFVNVNSNRNKLTQNRNRFFLAEVNIENPFPAIPFRILGYHIYHFVLI